MKDKVTVSPEEKENFSVKLETLQEAPLRMTGQITDRIYNEKGELIEEIVGHNLVVNSFLSLIMCLVKGDSSYQGAQYWAVGSGSSSWDSDLPDPDPTATHLTNEIGRIALESSDFSFLDSSDSVSTSPTNILQIKHTFGANDCNGSWREFGIFGGNATSSINSGIMINKKHHAVITKTSDMTVERTMRFTLSLA